MFQLYNFPDLSLFRSRICVPLKKLDTSPWVNGSCRIHFRKFNYSFRPRITSPLRLLFYNVSYIPYRKGCFLVNLRVNFYNLLRLFSLVSFNPFVNPNKKNLLVPGPKGKKNGFPYLEKNSNVLNTSFLVQFRPMFL